MFGVSLLNCAILAVVAVSISVGVMFIVRKRVKLENLKTHHDVTDPMMAVLGTLFAILLGFMLANAMQRFENARETIQQEAGAVGDLFRLADGLPEAPKLKIRKDSLEYLDAVIGEEFTDMKHRKFSSRAWKIYATLWKDCLHYEPQTQAQNNIHQLLVGAMTKTGECRRDRFAQLRYSLPSPLWFVLIFGGMSTIGFTYFFAVDNIKLQIAMVSVITIIVSLNIYMLAGYDAPFSGDIAVTSAAFEAVRESLLDAQKADP